MMRSLFSGVSGLKNHQLKMDVIGNNIANVNTLGFKGSRVVFQDLFSQTSSPASSAGDSIGGTNPQQVGLGVSTSTVDTLQTRTSTQYTGNTFDLAIEGDGFFKVEGNGDVFYTRAGNFYLDDDDYLVTGDGYYVQAFVNSNMYDNTGAYVDPVDGGGNYQANLDDKTDVVTTPGTPTNRIKIDHNYYKAVSVDKSGNVTALDKNDERVYLGVVSVSTFANSSALEKSGGNFYRPTNNSGAPEDKVPGDLGAGLISPGTLEMSNVDLSQEFTEMILTQRGFQANSRIITVSDTLLEELVNLKR